MSSFQRDPESARNPVLPADFKDLIELIKAEQRTEYMMSERKEKEVKYARVFAPLIFAELSRTIDHDLLFTTETELVMPVIKKIVMQWLSQPDPTVKPNRPPSWMVDVFSREVSSYIAQRRPR